MTRWGAGKCHVSLYVGLSMPSVAVVGTWACTTTLRPWLPSQAPPCGGLQAGAALPPRHSRVRLMSYNVLADHLAHEHSHELYNSSPRYALEWGYRCKLILREIGEYMPDVLCLQGVHSTPPKSSVNLCTLESNTLEEVVVAARLAWEEVLHLNYNMRAASTICPHNVQPAGSLGRARSTIPSPRPWCCRSGPLSGAAAGAGGARVRPREAAGQWSGQCGLAGLGCGGCGLGAGVPTVP
jgi:hypothetical protein